MFARAPPGPAPAFPAALSVRGEYEALIREVRDFGVYHAPPVYHVAQEEMSIPSVLFLVVCVLFGGRFQQLVSPVAVGDEGGWSSVSFPHPFIPEDGTPCALPCLFKFKRILLSGEVNSAETII